MLRKQSSGCTFQFVVALSRYECEKRIGGPIIRCYMQNVAESSPAVFVDMQIAQILIKESQKPIMARGALTCSEN